jgi:hypothetical protein
MPDRLRVSLKRQPAMTVTRIAIHHDRLVYVICADRKLKYPLGRSPIAYIGTTQNGVDRIAASVAYRAYDILGIRGVQSFETRVVTTAPRKGLKSWRLLERALLLGFRERYGGIPCCNVVGSGIVERNEFKVFSRDRIRDILVGLEQSGVAPAHEPID